MYFFLSFYNYEVSELELNKLTEVVRILICLFEVHNWNLDQAVAVLTDVFVIFYGLKQTTEWNLHLYLNFYFSRYLQIIIYYRLIS
jgi:hypothetical protein